MSGIYIHIPFCKQKCHYCNFYSVASVKAKGRLIQAIKNEIVLQKNFLKAEKVNSIYFGGGTPSVLTEKMAGDLLETIFKSYSVDGEAEITLEANPDDLGDGQLDGIWCTLTGFTMYHKHWLR